jgi:hypothetical protein
MRVYNSTVMNDLYNALHKFTQNQPDPKAAIIFVHPQPGTYMLYFFYDGPQPVPQAFSGLFEIPSMMDTTQTKSYTEMVSFHAPPPTPFKFIYSNGKAQIVSTSFGPGESPGSLACPPQGNGGMKGGRSANNEPVTPASGTGSAFTSTPPASTASTPPRSPAMGSRTSVRVSQSPACVFGGHA